MNKKSVIRTISAVTIIGVAFSLLPIGIPSAFSTGSAVGSCTLSSRSGRTIVYFDGTYIRSDKSQSDATKGPINTNILSGRYDVTLVSYDPHSGSSNQHQDNEKWYLILKDSRGSMVANTNAVSDLPDNLDTLTEVVNSDLVLSQDVYSVTAFRSEEHTSELQSHSFISYAVFCLKKKIKS